MIKPLPRKSQPAPGAVRGVPPGLRAPRCCGGLCLLLVSALAVAAAPAEPAREEPPPARAGLSGGGTIKLVAYDRKGRAMDLAGFLAWIGRADRKEGDTTAAGIFVSAPDGRAAARPTLSQTGSLITLSWERLPRVQLSLPWPIEEDGVSTVWADRESRGFSDGEAVYLNEEIALTQHRFFRDAWLKHTKDMDPPYQPGSKAKKRAEKAKALMAEAQSARGGEKRAKLFDRALYEISLAWQAMLFEHGLQIAHNDKHRNTLRFGLTLDESLLQRLDHYPWIIEMARRSGANWVRLVLRSNPSDFTYARLASFNEYDAVVKDLRAAGLRIMGCVLDTAQWPSNLTPEIYAERVKNLVLHYRGQIFSWEVGSEINGDWLGGVKTPLSLDQAFRVYSAAAAQVKSIEPTLETVATLYWWEGTAPDEDHSLFGWLTRYVPEGFGKNLDVVSLSLQPEDNPAGLAFERVFERVHQLLPEKRLILGSFGYGETGEEIKGYWWLHPDDVDGARKDLAILYTTASCGLPRSACGGFWWQTLDQMLPENRKATDLYRVYRRTLQQLGR